MNINMQLEDYNTLVDNCNLAEILTLWLRC